MPDMPGGLYSKSRHVQDHVLSSEPPHVRETWDWLLRSACQDTPRTVDGVLIEPGQVLTTCVVIRKELSWLVGYRPISYTLIQIQRAIRILRKLGLITTTRATRGILITITSHGLYGDSKPDENHNESDAKASPARKIFDHWNSKKIIVHKVLSDDIRRKINAVFNNKYTTEEVIEAIDNYAFVLSSPKHYWQHKWTLKDFIGRGLDRFVSSADPLNNFLSDKTASRREKHLDDILKSL